METRLADPIELGEHYVVLFENSRVRVLEVRLQPGEDTPMHWHPANVAYDLADQRIRFVFPDGSSKVIDKKAGRLAWSDGEAHATQNVGNADAVAIIVELKD